LVVLDGLLSQPKAAANKCNDKNEANGNYDFRHISLALSGAIHDSQKSGTTHNQNCPKRPQICNDAEPGQRARLEARWRLMSWLDWLEIQCMKRPWVVMGCKGGVAEIGSRQTGGRSERCERAKQMNVAANACKIRLFGRVNACKLFVLLWPLVAITLTIWLIKYADSALDSDVDDMMFEKTAQVNHVDHFEVYHLAFERCRSLIDPALANRLAAKQMQLPNYFFFGDISETFTSGESRIPWSPGRNCMRAFAYRYGDAEGRRNATNLWVSRIIGYGVLASILLTAAILVSLGALQGMGMLAMDFVRSLPAWLTAVWHWLTD
jgi:hypothetical protein